jgi:hypothetical protein
MQIQVFLFGPICWHRMYSKFDTLSYPLYIPSTVHQADLKKKVAPATLKWTNIWRMLFDWKLEYSKTTRKSAKELVCLSKVFAAVQYVKNLARMPLIGNISPSATRKKHFKSNATSTQ